MATWMQRQGHRHAQAGSCQLKIPQNLSVGLVNLARLYRVKIYLCGCLRVVAQPLAYYRQRHSVVSGYRSPAVPAVIQCERHAQPGHCSHLLKVSVHLEHHVLVLPALASVFAHDDWGSVRKAGCNPWYNRVKTLSLPHEAMASITNRIP